MDGQHREVLVSEEDLGWPTGLALDYMNGNRIYWCDSKENLIESMKPDGTDRRIVISGGKKLCKSKQKCVVSVLTRHAFLFFCFRHWKPLQFRCF